MTKTWNVSHANTKQLAALYEVSTKTFSLWLKKFKKEQVDLVGERVGNFYTVRQVEFILNQLGLPPHVKVIFSSSKQE